MRNRLVHDYGNTEARRVFDVVSLELPQLIQQLDAFLAEHGV